jgi:hypothetical protein
MYFLSVIRYNPQNITFTVANGLSWIVTLAYINGFSWIVTSNRLTILCPALTYRQYTHGLPYTRTSGPLYIGLVLHIL